MSKQKTTFTLIDRCELKYHIPKEMIADIVAFIKPYVEKDPYSKSSPTGFYQVNSLYLDSPRLTFFQMKENELPDRMNMRIRSYGENPHNGPFFLEIKKKIGDRIKKYRGSWGNTIPTREWIVSAEHKSQNDYSNILRFIQSVHNYQTHPNLLTNYQRLAFFGTEEEYSRVTFDIDLNHHPKDEYDFTREDFFYSDSENVFQEDCNCILELKAPINAIPLWMRDLVVRFDLKRSGFSKYGTAVTETLLRKTNLGTQNEQFLWY
jgi:SPX domain protein involved in polyphosphate accumulation